MKNYTKSKQRFFLFVSFIVLFCSSSFLSAETKPKPTTTSTPTIVVNPRPVVPTATPTGLPTKPVNPNATVTKTPTPMPSSEPTSQPTSQPTATVGSGESRIPTFTSNGRHIFQLVKASGIFTLQHVFDLTPFPSFAANFNSIGNSRTTTYSPRVNDHSGIIFNLGGTIYNMLGSSNKLAEPKILFHNPDLAQHLSTNSDVSGYFTDKFFADRNVSFLTIAGEVYGIYLAKSGYAFTRWLKQFGTSSFNEDTFVVSDTSGVKHLIRFDKTKGVATFHRNIGEGFDSGKIIYQNNLGFDKGNAFFSVADWAGSTALFVKRLDGKSIGACFVNEQLETDCPRGVIFSSDAIKGAVKLISGKYDSGQPGQQLMVVNDKNISIIGVKKSFTVNNPFSTANFTKISLSSDLDGLALSTNNSSLSVLGIEQGQIYTQQVPLPTSFMQNSVNLPLRIISKYLPPKTKNGLPQPQGVEICSGVFADNTGQTPANTQIQQCLNNNKFVALPQGAYLATSGINLNSGNTLTTQGLWGATMGCKNLDAGQYATLVASPNFTNRKGVLNILKNSSDVIVDHLHIFGNRQARKSSSSYYSCASLNDPPCGPNFYAEGPGSNHTVQYSWFTNALRKVNLAWAIAGPTEPVKNAKLIGNCVHDSGEKYDGDTYSKPADGITVGAIDASEIRDNWIKDSTDVSLILGRATKTNIKNNIFEQRNPAQIANAAFMLTNWAFSDPLVQNYHADFTDAVISNNLIDCGNYCDIAAVFGLYPWLKKSDFSADHWARIATMGGTFKDNYIIAYEQGIVIAGSGTQSAPIVMSNNTIYRGSLPAEINNSPMNYCPSNNNQTRTYACNYSPDSFVSGVILSSGSCKREYWPNLCD